ncbi:hypothetical protein ACF3NR_10325 [Vaginella massiliensis]|uniref:hypothetical protein n=1 Tax=Vaginella massiliensis TaxID=1816680 RepID=UPI000838C789|nr:hypothetical protein [Vaginella massiliensis]
MKDNNHKVHIKSIRSRPRFKVFSTRSKKVVEELIRKHLAFNPDLGGYCNDLQAIIRVRKEKNKYWSPQLQLKLEPNEDDQQVLEMRGVLGPRPSIWTFFMFSYGFAGALTLTVGIYGLVEWMLGMGNFWIWSLVLSALITALTYAAAKYGQHLSKDQLERLHQFIDDIYAEGGFSHHHPKN